MKRILLSVICLCLCFYSFGQIYFLEIVAEGEQITGTDILMKENVTWSVKNESSGEIVKDIDAYPKGAFFSNNYLMFSLDIFSPKPTVNMKITFTVTVNSGRYIGYTGRKTYTLTGTDIDDMVENGGGFKIHPTSFFNKYSLLKLDKWGRCKKLTEENDNMN